MTATTPTIDQLRALPAVFDRTVAETAIDENGHMNITDYFREGAWAVWERLTQLGRPDDYIEARGLSFFTVEHHIRYVSELRLGQPYTVRVALVGRTGKALQGVAFFVDEEHDRLACSMEVMYVHVSMETRRAVAIPGDLTGSLDDDIAAHPWVAEVATGLSLRR